MSDGINLYLAQSPLQVINACEAASLHGAARNVLVLFDKDADRGWSQMMKAVGLARWDEVITFRYPKRLKFLYMPFGWWIVARMKRRFGGRAGLLFMGDFRSRVMNYVRTAVKPRKTYLLDDGSVTVSVQNEYFRNRIFFPGERQANRPRSGKRAWDIPYRVFYDADIASQPIDLFTIFDIEPVEGQSILRNPMARVKGHQAAWNGRQPAGCYYFGSKYSESGAVIQTSELAFLAGVLADAKTRWGEPVYYIPHRAEDPRKLEAVAALGFTLHYAGVPAEMFLLALEAPPRKVIGAYTTVLFTAAMILGRDRVQAYRISDEFVGERSRAFVSLTYDKLGSAGVDIVTP